MFPTECLPDDLPPLELPNVLTEWGRCLPPPAPLVLPIGTRPLRFIHQSVPARTLPWQTLESVTADLLVAMTRAATTGGVSVEQAVYSAILAARLARPVLTRGPR